MGPPWFLIVSLWITTFLVLTIFGEISPKLDSSHSSKPASAVRNKRQNSAEKWIETILLKMNDMKDELALSESAVKGLQGYFKTLGFPLTDSYEYNPKAKHPCGSGLVRENETNWTAFGSSSCVKLMKGLFTFADATGICKQQYRIGKDLAHPVVVSVDSAEKARDLLHILRGQQGLSYVWVDRRDTSHAGTVGLNCSELRIPGDNETEVDCRAALCGRLSGVVCEKPMVLSYVEVVRKQLEGNKRAEERDNELVKAQGEIRQLGKELAEERRLRKEEAAELVRKTESQNPELREEIKLLVDSFRAESNTLNRTLESETSSQVSTVAENSRRINLAADMDDAGSKRRLGELGEAVETNLTRIDSAVKTLKVWKGETARRLESLRTNLSGCGGEQVGQLKSPDERPLLTLQNVDVWDLAGPKRFDLEKAMGVWHRIEAIRQSSKYETLRQCWEDIFSLKAINTIGYTLNWRYVSSNEKDKRTYYIQVDPQSPHQWTLSYNIIWLTTDYENWAITMLCSNQSVSTCSYLWILSRTRTLPSSTLDMLRVTAETNGFPKANGGLYDQISC